MENKITFIPYEREKHQDFVSEFYLDEDNLAYVPHLFKDGTMLIVYDNALVGAYHLQTAYGKNYLLEYGLLKAARGKGIMYHALTKALPTLLENDKRVIANIHIANEKSKKTLETLGFTYDIVLSETMMEEGMPVAYTLTKKYCNS